MFILFALDPKSNCIFSQKFLEDNEKRASLLYGVKILLAYDASVVKAMGSIQNHECLNNYLNTHRWFRAGLNGPSL